MDLQNEELVLENNTKRFAPSIHEAPAVIEADEQLLADLKKIPEKLAFKIGEVGDLLGVKAYVLRYWETEFENLRPQKAKNNQRFYTKKEVELLFMIKKLLYRDRFSIEGARSALKKLKSESKKAQSMQGVADQIENLRDRTEDLVFALRRLKETFK